MNLPDLLMQCVLRRASDLHLSSGVPPLLRLDGDLQRVSDVPLTHDKMHMALIHIMTPAQHTQFDQTHECDFAYDLAGVSRFRVNVFQQARGISAVFRVIPHVLASLQDLHAPAIFSDLVQSRAAGAGDGAHRVGEIHHLGCHVGGPQSNAA